MTIEFKPFEKLARLNRDIVITEKIDGTNAAVVIVPIDIDTTPIDPLKTVGVASANGVDYFAIFAQSRNRLITQSDDNFGFARWVGENAATLVADLGEGTHFGEWWGSGIQRGYGLRNDDKRFSLFNSGRWAEVVFVTPGLACVPVLWSGPFSEHAITETLESLHVHGSAATSFERPEGIVIYHTAARVSFKVTLENDSEPKGGNRREHDVLPVGVSA